MSTERAKEIKETVGLLMFGYPGNFKLEEVINILSNNLKIKGKKEREYLIKVLADILDSNTLLHIEGGYINVTKPVFVKIR